jgi:NTE family protein
MTTPTASDHALSTYVAPRERKGLALCLSGGGFRAALFHLGALRRLNELGILSAIDTITAVSGGSILAAHLAATIRPWPAPGESLPDWDVRVATPFRKVTGRNIRTPAIMRRLLPWNWLRSSTGIRALAKICEHFVTSLKLTDLPERPRFVFCATDMAFGVNWTFDRRRMGDYQVGFTDTTADWPIARAVAASSAFPPVFNPLPIGFRADVLRGGKARGPKRDAAAGDLRLTDGGLYDNLGLEPAWKSHATLLVSDGGATFDVEPDRGLLWRLRRYPDVIGQQVASLRKRWLMSNFVANTLRGTYWGVGSAVENYELPAQVCTGYPELLVEEIIAEIRTDLDAFSAAEMDVLENHGYTLAAAAMARHVPELVSRTPIPLILPPYPELLNESAVRKALADSGKRRLLGRW